MKLGLVLAGGGSKGSYEVGALNALTELGYHFDVVTGTSIGALNGGIVASNQIERLNTLWDNLEASQILKDDVTQLKLSFDIDELLQAKNLISSFFKNYTKEGGADISPFHELINQYLDYDALKASNIEYGCVSVEFPSLKPVFTCKENYTCKQDAFNYMLASASCFPAFPQATFNDKHYIDGGYYDNLPITYNFQLGADRVIAIDLNTDFMHKHYLNHPLVQVLYPSWELGSFLDFNQEHIQNNKRLGYLDAMKKFGPYEGYRYAFKSMSQHSVFNTFAKTLIKNDLISEITTLNQSLDHSLKKEDYALLALEQLMVWFDYNPYNLYDMDQILNDVKTYYINRKNDKFDLVELQDLVLNHRLYELYLLILKNMVNTQNFNLDLGIASKLVNNQLINLHILSLFIIELINE